MHCAVGLGEVRIWCGGVRFGKLRFAVVWRGKVSIGSGKVSIRCGWVVLCRVWHGAVWHGKAGSGEHSVRFGRVM